MTHLGLPNILTSHSSKKRKRSVLFCAVVFKELWGREQSAHIASNGKQGKAHTSLSPSPPPTHTQGSSYEESPHGFFSKALCWFLALQKTVSIVFSGHVFIARVQVLHGSRNIIHPQDDDGIPHSPEESGTHTCTVTHSHQVHCLSSSSKHDILYRSIQ